MKKKISLLISILIIMTTMTVVASATSETANTYNYEIDGTEYTVTFEDNNLSAEKQEIVAAKLVGIEVSEPVPANILCTIFGHDYTYTTVKVVTHKVLSTAPRCKQDTYDVTGCEDCDYSEQTLMATTYIFCCPEE